MSAFFIGEKPGKTWYSANDMNRVILTPETIESALEAAVQTLQDGGLLVYPTETMYGVGVDATNLEAVSKLLAYKNRPAGKPISVLVANTDAAEALVELNETARNLHKTFLPGPVTVISKSKGAVDRRLVSEFDTLGIRISSHEFAAELARRFGKPITSTSANASGKARPYAVDAFLAQLSQNQQAAIDCLIDAGTLPRREPSTVIDTTTESQEIIRGGLLLEEIAPPEKSSSEEETAAIAAKLMKTLAHALPEKPIIFALEGEMGVGKTHFAKGLAAFLGVEGVVSSPTYTIMKEYKGNFGERNLKVIHMDCWRLQEVKAEEFGLEEYMKPGHVLIVEWAAPLLEYFHGLDEAVIGYRIAIEAVSEHERILTIGSL